MESSRRGLWIAIAALLLLCCGCAFVASAYFVWGDWLMQLLGVY
jgi:hypothetical protein